jgi:hypothetical protein
MFEQRPNRQGGQNQDQHNREQAAEYRAMPLRTIREMEYNGKIAVLDCGHRKALLVWLREGDSVRCRECYETGMEKAAQMIGGAEG